ncbi:hypothetical protein LH128_03359 [Sphingomonas sp. LH128]|nr:hypothetical protein LH128_03359 [Sphingomonas sp. LH128]
MHTFGIVFCKRVGGFAKRAEESVSGELDAPLTIGTVVESLMKARAGILAQIRALDAKVRSTARGNVTVRHLMTVPGVGVAIALGFVATIDDSACFRPSSSARAYLWFSHRIYASGESMKAGRISRRGDDFLRRSLYEAANALMTRIDRFSGLKSLGLCIARRGGFKKSKVALACKLATILHAMWTTGEEFRCLSAEKVQDA